MAYVKNSTWVEAAAPGMSAARLNNLETQYDQAYADAQTYAKGDAQDPSYRFKHFIHWASIDGFTVGGDAGYSILPKGSQLQVVTGSASFPYDAFIYTATPFRKLRATGKIIIMEFIIPYMKYSVAHTLWVRLGYTTPDPPIDTEQHVGWKVEAANSNVWASSGNGTNNSLTDTGIVLTNAAYMWNSLKLVWTVGTDCKFYIDNVLKATHTLYLPTQDDYQFHIHLRSPSQAIDQWFNFSRILIERM